MSGFIQDIPALHASNILPSTLYSQVVQRVHAVKDKLSQGLGNKMLFACLVENSMFDEDGMKLIVLAATLYQPGVSRAGCVQ